MIIWEVWPNRTGGHPLQYFTADMRRVPDFGENETEWQLLDPHHISPNAVNIYFSSHFSRTSLSLFVFFLPSQRQLEVFHLVPNTSYEFRIWSTNKLGAGERATIVATTTRKTVEEGNVFNASLCDIDVWKLMFDVFFLFLFPFSVYEQI